MNFEQVKTLDDLDSLDIEQMIEGHMSAERGDPEPGPNRGRSFWHGWRTRMMDLKELPVDEAHRQLVKAYVARGRS